MRVQIIAVVRAVNCKRLSSFRIYLQPKRDIIILKCKLVFETSIWFAYYLQGRLSTKSKRGFGKKNRTICIKGVDVLWLTNELDKWNPLS